MTTSACAGALTPLASGASVSPDRVLFESHGVVLVLGDDARVGEVAQVLARHRRTVVFAPGVEERKFGPRVIAVGRRVTAVRGYLGAFEADVRSESSVSNIGSASPNPNRFFDIVLDLRQQPLMAAELAPLGYFAPGEDPAARATAIESMRALVGRFTKPRYVGYQSELCAHSAGGLRGCTRCLEVCPARAISSAGNTIRVNPHLCQGCATCALTCPTGALSFKFPSPEALGERLQQALLGAGSTGANLIVHADGLGADALAAIARHQALSFAVNPLPAFGEELWLRALALGVSTLVLVDGGDLSEKSRMTIVSRVAQMRVNLSTLGKAQERLVWLSQDELANWMDARSGDKADAPAKQWGTVTGASTAGTASMLSRPAMYQGHSKRLATIDALRQLKAKDGASTAVELPAGAPFGEVRVIPQRCTLCFACTNLCPTGALIADNAKTQQLLFRENACVQCGICVLGCPENAISLHARFSPATMAETSSKVLHQNKQLACKSCGTPFVSRRLLASSLERIRSHPVLARGGRDALMTCPACRQQEMLNLS